MNFYLAEHLGFCSGVRRALDIVDRILSLHSGPAPVCILHEIVHNEFVVNGLLKRGVMMIDEPEQAPRGSTVIFSAHGVSDDIEHRVASSSLIPVDATCPLVKQVQHKAVSLSGAGFTILLFGKRGHREVEGILGRIPPGRRAVLIENEADAAAFVPVPGERYACLSQTTLNASQVDGMVRILSSRIPDLERVAAVCHATQERQDAVRRLARFCDFIVVVGSENSSNSRRLVEVAREAGAEALLAASSDALPEARIFAARNIGVTAGASAPDFLIQQVVDKLESCGGKRCALPSSGK